MSKRIITIGRQFGSNGRLIGIALAERLGINCYDKDLIKLASEHTDIPYDQLKLVDEKREKPWRYQVDENSNIDRHYRYGHIDEILFNLQSKIKKWLQKKTALLWDAAVIMCSAMKKDVKISICTPL